MGTYGSLSNVKIGDLRFLVTLASRVQTPNLGTGVTESFANPLEVYAAINPIGLQTFIGSEQIDTPITHRIVVRFIDQLDIFDVVLREITEIDGTVRQEIYRIRRISEWEGRQRFTVIDAELEKRDVTQPLIIFETSGGSNFDQSNVGVTGGTIDNTVIGGVAPSAGSFSTVTANSGVFLRSGMSVAVTTFVGTGSYTLNTSQFVLSINKTTPAATTVNLPSSPSFGQAYRIKDGAGNAATYNTTIIPAHGLIDGAASFVLSVNYMSVDLVFDGTNWIVL